VGIGDVFREAGSGSGIPSVDDARERVNENPKDAKAFRDLATALQAAAETDEAIEALESYVALRPKDTDALRELAALYLVQVTDAQQDYQTAELRTTLLATAGPVLQTINLGGQPLELDPISQAVSSVISRDSNIALAEAQEAAGSAVDAYRRIAALTPDDPTVQLELGEAARSAGDTATAVAAYEKYLTLVPKNDPTAREVRRLLTTLANSASG
jgi:tetratricopeptide (TPR) repeat protein